MTTSRTIWILCGLLLTLVTLPGSLELLVLTLGSILPPRSRTAATPPASPLPRLDIIVPAHNEAGTIARCVRSLLASQAAAGPNNGGSVTVVADNCTDRTARIARQAGAHVLIRHDPARRGKGYALEFAIRYLLDQGTEAIAVVDADSVVSTDLVGQFRQLLATGADAVQCRYGVLNHTDSSRTRLARIALMAFNHLRPLGRERLGLSVGLLGNGFALSRQTLLAQPCRAHSIVEDLEYHLQLVESGRRVRFAQLPFVLAEMPASNAPAATQRARWIGGRFRMITLHAPHLARRCLQADLRALEPLLDLLLLPLAFHTTLLLTALAIPWLPSRILALIGLTILATHLLAALKLGHATLRDLATLLPAIFNIPWMLSLLPSLLRSSRASTQWIRTQRHPRT